MIRRIFIANRGEIALRVLRTCRRLDIGTVLGASTADLDSLPARMADRTVCIGPPRPADSYLNREAMVHAAMATGCDAIHPGYGFLSERAVFARLAEENGLIFIGPTPAQIDAVGDKLRARFAAQAAGVPTVPGGAVNSVDDALTLAREIGTPMLVKAVGGGGGRGMKLVEGLADLPSALELASAEAGAAFGDSRVYLERYIASGRHVEVQVLGDGRGGVVHLGERDCSVQRRYQKLIEETPAPKLAVATRRALHAAAIAFAKSLNYRGAGTVEFLVDRESGAFYFLEMNARIQVEHPVTEAVTGVDLVEEQIAIAAGEGLRVTQESLRFDGCAIECRVNAENPARDFQPSPGMVTHAAWPEGDGLRVDTHITSGSRVPPFYDSLLGKIIAHGANRKEALARLLHALGSTQLDGVRTNLALQAELVADEEFAAGGVDTHWLGRRLAYTEA